MARVKQPVSIAGIEFDALISQERTLEAQVPEYPVETGYSVSDGIIRSAETLNMTLFLAESPVTWRDRHGTGQGRVERVCRALEDLYWKGEPVAVSTGGETFSDMAITQISFARSTETGYAREIPITLRRVRRTETETTAFPEDYGRGGETMASGGAAATTRGQTQGTVSGTGAAAAYQAAMAVV